MKKASILALSGLLFFAACENTGSSTIGTYEKEESSQASEKRESGSHEEKAPKRSEHETQERQVDEQREQQSEETSADTTNATVERRHGTASGAEIKTGANVPVEKNHLKP